MCLAVTSAPPRLLKRLEWLGKVLLALALAVLTWRPSRRARARSRATGLTSGRALLVRIDNRVGEALLTTPLTRVLADRGFEVHVLVHPRVLRVLEGLPTIHRLWPFSKTCRCLSELRSFPFDVVVNCGNWATASVTSALVARLAAPSAVVLGPANFPAASLADIPVPHRRDSRSEAVQRAHLLTPIVGHVPTPTLSFREPRATPPPTATPRVLINPGGRLGYRRVPPHLFAAAAREASALGFLPLITWGPGEERLAAEVLEQAPGASCAPPTDLDALAALMTTAAATVTNNTGPMHLSVAVGCPTLALFLHVDMERWGHPVPPHRMLDLTPVADDPAVEDFVRASTRDFLRGLTSPPARRA